MTELHNELVYLHQKYENLQNEWDSQQEHMAQMQAELFKVRNQMQQQSQFCASLGAVMGNLIWKASRTPPVVDMLLSGV
jgi:peptidoglycan hydrolase CwlO-like protein